MNEITFEMREFLSTMFGIYNIERTESNYQEYADYVENRMYWYNEWRIWSAGQSFYSDYRSAEQHGIY